MEAKPPNPKRGRSSINQLTPNAIEVTINKKELRVASNKEENNIMNMIVMAQMRHMIQNHIKRYEDEERLLTPKEVKDMADAVKAMAGASQEIYALQDKTGGVSRNEIPADKDMPLGAITFDVAATLAEQELKDEKVDTDGPESEDGVSGKAD